MQKKAQPSLHLHSRDITGSNESSGAPVGAARALRMLSWVAIALAHIVLQCFGCCTAARFTGNSRLQMAIMCRLTQRPVNLHRARGTLAQSSKSPFYTDDAGHMSHRSTFHHIIPPYHCCSPPLPHHPGRTFAASEEQPAAHVCTVGQ